MKKQLITSTLFLLSFTLGTAQRQSSLEVLQLEQFALPNGKYGNHAQAIVQDNYGFMWFGTQYGLHRWDGHKFKTYLHGAWDRSSISSNYIECIYVAKDGSMWIGTWGSGLNHFHHETDKFERHYHKRSDKNSISNNFISAITEDNDGKPLDRYPRRPLPHELGDQGGQTFLP